jgi:hypothetical protein
LNTIWPKVVENASAAQLCFDNRLYNAAASRESIQSNEAETVLATMRDFIAAAEKLLTR